MQGEEEGDSSLKLSKFKYRLQCFTMEVQKLREKETIAQKELEALTEKQKCSDHKFNEKIAALEAELAAANEKWKRLEKDVIKLQNEASSAYAQQHLLKQEFKVAVDSKNGTIEAMKAANHDLECSLKGKMEELEICQGKLKRQCELFDEIEKEVVRVKRALDETSMIVRSRENEVILLQKKMDKILGYKNLFVDKILSLDKKLKCAIADVSQKGEMVALSEGKIDNLMQKNDHDNNLASNVIQIKDSIISKLKSENKDLASQIHHLESILKRLQENNMSQERQLQEFQNVQSKVDELHDLLIKTNENLSTAEKEKQVILRRLQEQEVSFKAHKESCETEKENLKLQISTLKQRTMDLQTAFLTDVKISLGNCNDNQRQGKPYEEENMKKKSLQIHTTTQPEDRSSVTKLENDGTAVSDCSVTENMDRKGAASCQTKEFHDRSIPDIPRRETNDMRPNQKTCFSSEGCANSLQSKEMLQIESINCKTYQDESHGNKEILLGGSNSPSNNKTEHQSIDKAQCENDNFSMGMKIFTTGENNFNDGKNLTSSCFQHKNNNLTIDERALAPMEKTFIQNCQDLMEEACNEEFEIKSSYEEERCDLVGDSKIVRENSSSRFETNGEKINMESLGPCSNINTEDEASKSLGMLCDENRSKGCEKEAEKSSRSVIGCKETKWVDSSRMDSILTRLGRPRFKNTANNPTNSTSKAHCQSILGSNSVSGMEVNIATILESPNENEKDILTTKTDVLMIEKCNPETSNLLATSFPAEDHHQLKPQFSNEHMPSIINGNPHLKHEMHKENVIEVAHDTMDICSTDIKTESELPCKEIIEDGSKEDILEQINIEEALQKSSAFTQASSDKKCFGKEKDQVNNSAYPVISQFEDRLSIAPERPPRKFLAVSTECCVQTNQRLRLEKKTPSSAAILQSQSSSSELMMNGSTACKKAVLISRKKACFCNDPPYGFMVNCINCKHQFHAVCIGSEASASGSNYVCGSCKEVSNSKRKRGSSMRSTSTGFGRNSSTTSNHQKKPV